ncbi:MAG: ABC transporter permease [Clostridia bacterium]|nr:ABC transporter permease [Clostridia bacterium]
MSPAGRQFRAYLASELRRLVRNSRFLFFTAAFPALFYLLLVHVFPGGELAGLSANGYLLASMGAYGVMGAGLNLFGTRLAIERNEGWMQLLRTTPLRLGVMLGARFLSGVLFGLGVALLMLAVGATQGVRMDAALWVTAWLALAAGALPFGALGLALGYLVDSRTGQVVTLVIYFFLAVFGGLWWPVEIMPPAMQDLAHDLPSYHFAHLVRLAMAGRSVVEPLLILLAYTVAFLGLAAWAYRRDERRVYA